MWVYFWGALLRLSRGNLSISTIESWRFQTPDRVIPILSRGILKSGHSQGGIWPIFLHSILPPLPGCASKGGMRRTQTIGRNLWRPNLLLFLDNPPLFQTNYSLRTSNVLITILREVSTHKSWCLFGKSPSGWGGERYRKNIVPDFRTYWGLYFTNIIFF